MADLPNYDNSNDMQVEIEEYFKSLEIYKDNKLVQILDSTISGLCYYLGFASRQSFYDYEKKKEFAYTIKRARLRIQVHYETRLNTQYVAGAIFALKNFGWTDKQEIETINKNYNFVIDESEKNI